MTDDLSFMSAFDKRVSIFTVWTKSGSVPPGGGGLELMMIPPGPLGINYRKMYANLSELIILNFFTLHDLPRNLMEVGMPVIQVLVSSSNDAN